MRVEFEGAVPAWLRHIAQGISYKPGWSLRIAAHSTYGRFSGSSDVPYMFSIAAICTVEDVVTKNPMVLHGPGMTIYADHAQTEEKMVVEMIFRCIRSLEEHEIEEQFLYNGVRIYDPHRDYAEKAKLFELAALQVERLQEIRRG
jgi:hypothetical protein